MSNVLMTGITTITTISAITLSDEFSLHDMIENFRELGGWINSWLPRNLIIRSLFYGAGKQKVISIDYCSFRPLGVYPMLKIVDYYFYFSA